jgi:hypothetical protein
MVAEARDTYVRLMPDYVRFRGSKHQDTLAALARLAYWTGVAGDAAGARARYAALLPAAERLLGSQHRVTQEARAGLAP